MALPKQKIRVMAATPIEVAGRRLLPSVLVRTIQGETGPESTFQIVQLRPISVVEEGPDGTRWIEIPNATTHALSMMAAAGAGVAVVSLLILGLVALMRGKAD